MTPEQTARAFVKNTDPSDLEDELVFITELMLTDDERAAQFEELSGEPLSVEESRRQTLEKAIHAPGCLDDER